MRRWSPSRGRALLLLAASLLVSLAQACTQVGTDPNAAVAIELIAPESPSVVLGDTLRDSSGAAVPLVARAFNSRNVQIPSPRLTFITRDTTRNATVDSLTGFVIGRKLGDVTIFANVGNLPSAPIVVHVVPRPDELIRADSVRDALSVIGTLDATGRPLQVKLRADTTPLVSTDSLIPVQNYLVRFRIVAPAGLERNTDTTRLVLVNDLGRPSLLDTTDVLGIASRKLRISPAVPRSAIPDSVAVEASARRPDGSPVPGSPIVFTTRLVRSP
ncbi:MAG: hypothetical protein M3068_04960 [Gemmatimonadota bacterium]|nr:hypothetical protein [Gemmatimonadota bacterium]